MVIGLAFGLAAVAMLAAASKRAAAPPDPAAPDAPAELGTIAAPKAGPDGWVKLQDAPGLEVRSPDRSWTSPAVRELLLSAGQLAAQLGGKLQLGDVGPADRGVPFPPHKSHRWGRDMDIAYTLDAYPTPDDVPVDPRVVAVLDALAPFIERAGVNIVRAPAFAAAKFKVSIWDGHAHHLHLRLRPELVAEVKTVGFLDLGDVDEDE